MNGAQGYFGVEADLSVLGKIVGHEYPSAGALGGREDIMQMVVGKKEDERNDLGQKVFTAGTMAGTNITMAAAYKAIQCIEKTNTIEIAANVADDLVLKLNNLFADYHLPFFTYNFKSVIQLRTSGFYAVPLTAQNALREILHRRKNSAKYSLLLALEHINTLQSIRMYTSLQHDKKDIIDQTLQGFENFCIKLT
jgi:glutamate-1-semialdehyde 2,1-aminomutase